MARTEGSKNMSLTVKNLITGEAVVDRKKPRRALAIQLQDLIKRMGEVVPTEETLMRMISEVRNHPVSPLDAPWSLGCLAEYEIPPEAMPVIMWVYKKRLREATTHFTIRQALWIARLHHIIESSDLVGEWADAYAFREQVCWILGEPFFTRGEDISLMRHRNDPRCFPGIYSFPFGEREIWEERLRDKGFKVE